MWTGAGDYVCWPPPPWCHPLPQLHTHFSACPSPPPCVPPGPPPSPLFMDRDTRLSVVAAPPPRSQPEGEPPRTESVPRGAPHRRVSSLETSRDSAPLLSSASLLSAAPLCADHLLRRVAPPGHLRMPSSSLSFPPSFFHVSEISRRRSGSAWTAPVGRCAAWRRASANGANFFESLFGLDCGSRPGTSRRRERGRAMVRGYLTGPVRLTLSGRSYRLSKRQSPFVMCRCATQLPGDACRSQRRSAAQGDCRIAKKKPQLRFPARAAVLHG